MVNYGHEIRYHGKKHQQYHIDSARLRSLSHFSISLFSSQILFRISSFFVKQLPPCHFLFALLVFRHLHFGFSFLNILSLSRRYAAMTMAMRFGSSECAK